MNEKRVRLRDYHLDPATRYEAQDVLKQGSGEGFRKDCVAPAFAEAILEGVMLVVDIGGTWGVPPSFREETFGGLVRDHLDEGEHYDYRKHLRIESEDPSDVAFAWKDIEKMVKEYKPKKKQR
jgi:hypothetical protein